MITPTPLVRRMFDQSLRLFVGTLGLDSESDIKWPNIPFTPKHDKMYLDVHMMYRQTETVSCGEDGFERLSGLYQIDIYDIVGIGMADSELVANALVEHFRGGTVLCNECARVHITRAWTSTPMEEQDRYKVLVCVDWWCDTQKTPRVARHVDI